MRHLAETQRLSRRATYALLAILPAVALALAGHGRSAAARDQSSAASRSVVLEPRLSRTEAKYIGAAWRAIVARDPACRGSAGSELARGSPSHALTSKFVILRLPPTSADRLRTLLSTSGGAWSAGVELYLNQIRQARSAFGASFYVLPAGNVTGQRGVPARCGPEQVALLKRQPLHLPQRRRARILAAQTRYLAYLRYLALHAEGVCAAFVRHAQRRDLTDGLMCATLADFNRWGVLADASSYLGGSVAAFWTVVPDGVATVTLTFSEPNGHPLAVTTVRPVNNVVVAKEPYRAPYESGFPSTIVLRAADGQMIKQVAVTPNMPTLCGYGC